MFYSNQEVFSIWKQIGCRFEQEFERKEDPIDYEIEDETYTSWIDEGSYGRTEFVENNVAGMDIYHKLAIDLVKLMTREEEEEQEDSSQEREDQVNQEESENADPSLLVPIDPKLLTSEMLSKPDQIDCKVN